MDVYVVSNNGLGDNIYMFGAINFIRTFYKRVFFLCKERNYKNLVLLYSNCSNVTCQPYDKFKKKNKNSERVLIKKFLSGKYKNPNIDILVCGFRHKKHFKSKITNSKYIKNQLICKDYSIACSELTDRNFGFIKQFYLDMKLNLTYFYEFFEPPEYNYSKEIFNNVSDYYLVFIHSRGSNRSMDISKLINKYIDNEKVLLICSDYNIYSENHHKYVLAQDFVFKKLVYYIDIIRNCDEIHIIDSCFVGIVLPLLKTNRLKTNVITITKLSHVGKRESKKWN